MMRPFSRTSIFSLIAMGSLSLVPSLSALETAGTPEAARREIAARDARQLVQEARNAYKAGKYTQAVEHYRSALLTLPKTDTPSGKRFEQFVKQSLSDALIARAIDYRTVGRYDEAISFLREALQLAPDNKRAEVELLHTSDPVRHNPALTPQHIGDVEEVKRLLELAYGQIDLGKYDDAVDSFRGVLKIDPYNKAARHGMESARRHQSAYYQVARSSNRAKMLSDVDKLWEESVTDGAPVDMQSGGEFVAGVDAEVQESFARRLSDMIIPQIAFDEATITDVVDVLQNQIKRFESNGAERHINVTTNFGRPDSEAYKRLMGQTVRLTLTQVSVKEVLDMLVNQLGISYYFTPTGVELSYSGRDFGPLMDRTFNVPPHFFDPSAQEEDEDEEDEEEGFADETGGGRMAVRRVNPVQVLKQMGISFPEGATARYSPSTRRLAVRNTAHNLSEIEDLLNTPLEEERQIVLNVIAMEVSEDDLKQLGFDWLLNVNINGSLHLAGGQETDGTYFNGETRVQGGQEGALITGGLRSGKQVFSAGSASLDNLINTGSVASFRGAETAVSPAIFGVRGVWETGDVTVVMRGLAQNKGADILQNPRIIFSPGAEEQVVFANVREMFFPETWEAPQIAAMNGNNWNNNNNNNNNNNVGNSGSTAAIGATPSDFVRFGMTEDTIGGIGTILQVHSAEISENGRFVTLALTSTTNEFEGFINWGSPIHSAMWAGDGKIEYFQLNPNYILQPMIKRYVENTKITVVPGTVIVMGGLKEASVVRFEDKVPVLGDLPLVGRLFRSSGEQKKRKALIYFAKVDVIDPTGRDVATGERPSMNTDKF
ncbi:MAG: tetratricopeptide repeat protein [Akkermansia sp.]|nr:tetratricopeptide repeat protein [Akkermansia sp.]